MTSEKLPLRRARTGDMVDPNIVPRPEDVGNIVRLLASQLERIDRMDVGEALTFSIHRLVPLVEIECIATFRFLLNGINVGSFEYAQQAYMQIVFDGLGLDSGVSPSLYYDNSGNETGGTSYAQNSEAN